MDKTSARISSKPTDDTAAILSSSPHAVKKNKERQKEAGISRDFENGNMNTSLKKTMAMGLRKIKMSLVILFVQNEITLELLKS